MLTALLLMGLRSLLRRLGFALIMTAILAVAASRVHAQRGLPADSFPPPARAVSAIVAPRWIAEDRRDAFGEAERVMEALRIVRGMTVADIGAGDGYYVAKLTARVGPNGVVLANDIEPRYLELLRNRVDRSRWTNVEVIEGLPHDPLLPRDSVDVALMIHMYHEIENPFGMLYNLSYALRANGRLGILDVDAPTDRHGTPQGLLRCELRAMGYRFARRVILADGAYLMIFNAPTGESRPRNAAQVRERVAKANCRA